MLEAVPTSSLRTIVEACEGGRVLSSAFLDQHNFPPPLVAVLVANHMGTEPPGGGRPPKSTSERYRGTPIEAPARAQETPGAYDFDVLLMLAGALDVPVAFTEPTRARCAAVLRGAILAKLDTRDD